MIGVEQWTENGRPVVKLEFYENGHLKQEERFSGSELTYGAYYSQEGQIKRTIGQRVRPELQRVNPAADKPHGPQAHPTKILPCSLFNPVRFWFG